jgi:arsenate reductase
MQKKRVLFLCTENSARSQMAEGILRHEAGDRFEVYSTGTNPTSIRLEAVEVIAEIGIDIRDQFSKSVDSFEGQEFDFVITVCDHARESCPIFPGQARHLHMSFDDPANVTGSYEERVASFRRTRDEIRKRLRSFVGEHVGVSYAMHG